mmetsp:Transcript_101049/g.294225  ORF Transcript_101049/g.294225 Transcript_101049/m.294225 type:complete len:263 (-) Transcript_101049:1078-1866(-)
MVEVLDNVHGIALGNAPFTEVGPVLLACLGHDQVLLRPKLMHTCHIVEANLRQRRPRLVPRVPVPVEAQTPDVVRSSGVAIDCLRSLEHPVPVVVPDNQLQVQPTGAQAWAEVISDEVALFLWGVGATLPPHLPSRLILHCHGPERQPNGLHLLSEAQKVPCPGFSAVGPEFAAFDHGRRILHPRRWAPGAANELQRCPCCRHGPADEWEDRRVVALEAKACERQVVLLIAARPITLGKIARGDVQPAQFIAETSFFVEIRI